MNIFVFLHETYADWEVGYVLPELARAGQKITTFGLTNESIRSLGGLNVKPDLPIDCVDAASVDALILPGGLHWRTFESGALDELVHTIHKLEKVVAGICGATGYLAKIGMLDRVAHTSNDLSFLKERAAKYAGEKSYRRELAVSDQGVITASGLGAVDFTYLIMRDLGVHSVEKCREWYWAFKFGEEPDAPVKATESQCIRVKLLPGKTDQFLSWARALPTRLKEVKEALRSEGLDAELMLFDPECDGGSILLYTKGQSLAEANRAFERSKLSIDVEAKKRMAETWDFSSVRQVERLLEVTLQRSICE